MAHTALEALELVLANPTDLAHVSALVAADATYVSLNSNDPDLTTVMPWCGTGQGPERIVDTFIRVRRCWDTLAFAITDRVAAGEAAALFGTFTYRSTVLGKTVTSPFAILAKAAGGKLTFMQFMEDTFATAASFRESGTWRFRSDPDGGPVSVGDRN